MDKTAEDFKADMREVAVFLESAEQHARECGFFETMHAINAAKNKLGWECIYLMNKAKMTPVDGGEKQ